MAFKNVIIIKVLKETDHLLQTTEKHWLRGTRRWNLLHSYKSMFI